MRTQRVLDSANRSIVVNIDQLDYVVEIKRDDREPQYVNKKGARHWVNKLEPIVIKAAASGHPLGIVEL